MTNTKTDTSNTLNATLLFNQLDKLHDQRKHWEDGSYKQSNLELYNILSECLDLYVQVCSNVSLRRKLANGLKQNQITVTASTSLQTRIIRWVFGDCGNRAFVYASVITAAYQANIDPLKLPNWIIAEGGVENVRRSQKKSDAPAKSDLENLAIDTFDSSKALSAISEKVADLSPNSSATHSYSAALVRQNKSGSFEIVFASNKISTVKSLLLDAGQSLHSTNKVKSVANSVQAQSNSVASAIANTVSVKN